MRAISDRTRERDRKAALKILPSGTTIRDYVVGRANARATTWLKIGVFAFVCWFIAVAVTRGGALLPGPMFFYLMWRSICPQRGIVVAEQGFALVNRNLMSSRPTKVLATVSFGEMGFFHGERRAQVAIGGDVVTLRADEYNRLVQALNYSQAPLHPPYGMVTPGNVGRP